MAFWDYFLLIFVLVFAKHCGLVSTSPSVTIFVDEREFEEACRHSGLWYESIVLADSSINAVNMNESWDGVSISLRDKIFPVNLVISSPGVGNKFENSTNGLYLGASGGSFALDLSTVVYETAFPYRSVLAVGLELSGNLNTIGEALFLYGATVRFWHYVMYIVMCFYIHGWMDGWIIYPSAR